jgi:hypothetical protein
MEISIIDSISLALTSNYLTGKKHSRQHGQMPEAVVRLQCELGWTSTYFHLPDQVVLR